MIKHPMLRTLFAGVASVLLSIGVAAEGQAAVDGQPWENGRRLEPLSKTAMSITGPISFTRLEITFGRKAVPAQSLGSSRRAWDSFLKGTEQTATVYKLGADPGPMLRRNTLCGGKKQASYLVVYEEPSVARGTDLGVEVWSGEDPPQDGTSPGFCGGLSYVLER